MDAERIQQLQAVFDAAFDLDPAARADYLDSACAGDPELWDAVARLLDAAATAGGAGFIEGAVREALLGYAEPGLHAGLRLGAYRLLRPLGHGGMGAVWLAERADEAYDAVVAVKLIRGGFADPELERRFRSERQILADLHHPNIARLLDGGTTPDGTPYLVMEYVDGVPVTEYCDARGLSVERRLELFLRICEAVQAAHRNLVVHRDLKPDNILVTEAGVPKLLDFGIAKLVDPASVGAATTRTALRAMTPAYASPEQVRGAAVTVATDVYGLGLLLYELLAGRLPYDVRGRTPGEAERIILEREPARPGARVDHAEPDGPSPAEVAGRRSTTPAKLRRRLEGDLDTIALAALRKDPDRRYASVSQLADDVARHLAGLPISARADAWRYRAGKFVRRHRVGVGVAAAGVLLLAGFAATMTVQARRIARERDAATRARASAEQVTSFLVELFQVPDPFGSAGGEITAREILDRGAARITAELRDQPATRATMMDVIGGVYQNLGLYEEAAPLLDSALALRRAQFGPEHRDVAASLHSTAALLTLLGEWDSARVVFQHALDMRRRLLEPNDPDLARTLDGLASLESEAGNYDAAERLEREALAIDRAAYGAEHVIVASDLVNLGIGLRRNGDYDDAEPFLRDGLAMRRRLLGNDHIDVAHALNQMARLLALEGRPAEAEPYAREGLAVRRRIVDGPHPETAASLGSLAGILADMGDLEGAIAARRESLEMLRELFGDEHPYTAATLQSLANAQHRLGRLDSARANYEYAIELQRRVLAPDDPNLGFALTGLGRVLVDLGRAAEAEPYLRAAVEVRRGGLPPDHWFIAASESALGRCLTRLGRYDEAEELLARSYRTMQNQLGGDDARTIEVRDQLVELYEASGRPERAAVLRGAS